MKKRRKSNTISLAPIIKLSWANLFTVDGLESISTNLIIAYFFAVSLDNIIEFILLIPVEYISYLVVLFVLSGSQRKKYYQELQQSFKEMTPKELAEYRRWRYGQLPKWAWLTIILAVGLIWYSISLAGESDFALWQLSENMHKLVVFFAPLVYFWQIEAYLTLQFFTFLMEVSDLLWPFALAFIIFSTKLIYNIMKCFQRVKKINPLIIYFQNIAKYNVIFLILNITLFIAVGIIQIMFELRNAEYFYICIFVIVRIIQDCSAEMAQHSGLPE